MNIDSGGPKSCNPYSTFNSFEKKISCQNENRKWFQDLPWGGKVKVHMYVAEWFLREKELLNKRSCFQKD